nr:phosphotransferase [Saccharomonospora cyanea]
MPEPTNPDLGGTVVEKVLRVTDKSCLALGHRGGNPVVVKTLRTDAEPWVSTFAEEIRLYLVFTENPPPVRIPALVHTDGRCSLVLERIDGDPVSTRRYAPRSLPPPLVESAVDTVSVFARWTPPSGVLRTVFDYPARIAKYHGLGFLDDSDHAALHRLLAEVSRDGMPWQPNHGDPIPPNLLIPRDGGCVLVDFEFTGLYLPGLDLALLHTVLATTPGASARVERIAEQAGIEVPFLLNRALVLARERRLDAETPDGRRQHARSALLSRLWEECRSRLHGDTGFPSSAG